MQIYRIIIVFIQISFTIVNCEKSKNVSNFLSIVFLLEQNQNELTNDITVILKNFENNDHKSKINGHFVFINRDETNSTMNSFCSILHKEGITAIIDMTYLTWEEGYELIEKYKIPYIIVDITISPFIRVVEKYIKQRSGQDAALIFQNEQNFDEALYYLVKESELRVILLNGMKTNFIEKLKNIRPTPSYYAIFATTHNLNNIFKKILSKKQNLRGDKWHLLFMDYKSNDFQYKYSTPLLTKISPDSKHICRSISLSSMLTSSSSSDDDECEISDTFSFSKILIEEIIRYITKLHRKMNFNVKFLNCANSHYNNESLSTEEDEDFSDLISFIEDNSIMRVDNGKITPNLNLIIEIFDYEQSNEFNKTAIWYDGKLLPSSATTITPAKRFFRIGTAEAIPWSYIRRDPVTQETILDEDGNPIWEGYCIDLIEKLSEKMNFDYQIVPPRHGTFGKRLNDGNWDGLIGDLVRGETEIAVAALKMTAEREEVIDFVAPYFEQTGISIVIRKAVKQTSLFKFMTVLRLEVWLSIVAALVVTAFMIWILEIYSPYSARNNKIAYPYPCRDFTLKESFWFALTSFTPQGGGETPKAISGRTLIAAYWLFVVLMLATFTANLAAFLTVERMQTPVQSLEQLARQSRINYTVVEASDTHKYFINMKFAEDTLYRLWKELTLNATADQSQYRIWDYPIKEQYGHILMAINDSEPVKDATEGFRKVNEHENADFAFIHDSAEIKYEISKNCNLTEVGEVFAEQPYAIAVQQGSHIQDEISYAILELQKDRFFESLIAKFWNNSATKECSKSEDNEGITLESLGGVFIATLFGLALAMITLVGEIIYYRRKNLTNKKITPVKEQNIKNQHYHRSIFKTTRTPPPPFDATETVKNPDNVTLGSEFIPVRQRNRISYISVAPKDPVHGKNQMHYVD